MQCSDVDNSCDSPLGIIVSAGFQWNNSPCSTNEVCAFDVIGQVDPVPTSAADTEK